VEVGVQQVFEVLLPPAAGRGFAQLGEDELLESGKADFTPFDVAAEAGIEARIALGDKLGETPLAQDPAGDLERQGVGVETPDVGMEEVLKVYGGPAQLGVEVDAAGAEAAGPEYAGKCEHELLDVGVELVGVPAEQEVARVGVD